MTRRHGSQLYRRFDGSSVLGSLSRGWERRGVGARDKNVARASIDIGFQRVVSTLSARRLCIRFFKSPGIRSPDGGALAELFPLAGFPLSPLLHAAFSLHRETVYRSLSGPRRVKASNAGPGRGTKFPVKRERRGERELSGRTKRRINNGEPRKMGKLTQKLRERGTDGKAGTWERRERERRGPGEVLVSLSLPRTPMYPLGTSHFLPPSLFNPPSSRRLPLRRFSNSRCYARAKERVCKLRAV